MPVDFPDITRQVKEFGQTAQKRQRHLEDLRKRGFDLLTQYADHLDELAEKVESALGGNPVLRCAVPVTEALDHTGAVPPNTNGISILAADGSQINPNRHGQVEYSLINVGAISMQTGSLQPPQETVQSRLVYDEALYTNNGIITEEIIALMRDLSERQVLVTLAKNAQPPIVTLTDGPLELFREPKETQDFQKRFNDYLDVLSRLCETRAATAGYVDKPASDLVVRLLEITLLPPEKLDQAGKDRPLRGLRDTDLFGQVLQEPGARSAVFAIQSVTAKKYRPELAPHFFYLNVGRPQHPYLARVEIPAWVASDSAMLTNLQAVLVSQCTIMGNRPYPYILHRAHEVAVVSRDEQTQLEGLIVAELLRQGVPPDPISGKQSAKDLPGRTRYKP